MVVAFREPLPPHAKRLMETLGVSVRIDPRAPEPLIKASGRSGKTRRELSEEARQRMRDSYYARPDKQIYSRSRAKEG
jgi:hypothetical protein